MAEVYAERIFSATADAAGQPVRFSAETQQVDVTFYEIPFGAFLPVHKHPALRMGYFLSGTLRVINDETRQSTTHTAGDFAVEAVGSWHRGENIGADPVRILVIDIVDPGAENVVLR